MIKHKKSFVKEGQETSQAAQTAQQQAQGTQQTKQNTDPYLEHYQQVVTKIQDDCDKRFTGAKLQLNGTLVTFSLTDTRYNQTCLCRFDLNDVADQEDGDEPEAYRSYFLPKGKPNLGSWVVSRYCIDRDDKKFEAQYDGDSTHRCWDIYFGDANDQNVLREILIYDFRRVDDSLPDEEREETPAVRKEETPVVRKTVVPQVPGMPAGFGSNRDNVKIAQTYLVANGANISTSKSIDGIDGLLGPKTANAIIAYMQDPKHPCDFAKFWADAQAYVNTKKNVDNMRAQNMQTQMQQTQNLQLTQPEMKYQAPQGGTQTTQQPTAKPQSLEEVKRQFYDIFNRMNNATILQ